MKKFLISAIIALTLGTQAFAVPAMHKLFAFKQSDGTTVMLYRCGDEHFSFMTTPDNQIVMKNASGIYCYAQKQNGAIVASSIRVHDMEQRTAEETAFIANNTLKPADLVALSNDNTESTVSSTSKAVVRKVCGASTSDGLGKYGTSSPGAVPSIGKVKIPVIMAEFPNKKFLDTTTPEYMTRYFNEEGFSDLKVGGYQMKGSVKDYFLAQSNGMFEPTFEIVAKVQVDNNYEYYGAHSSTSVDVRLRRFVKDAVAKAVEAGVNFKNYYHGTTNKVPLVCVLFAGMGEATSGDDDTLWPQEGELGTFESNMSNFNFASFFIGNELQENDKLMGMGVFVHEFSHGLSLPDFYPTDYSYSSDDGFGDWSVMDQGEYTDNSYNPTGYTAYEKSFMGWLDMKELTDAESITLSNPNTNENSAVIIRNPEKSTETFILENRQSGTWYPASFGSGLMVTRINYDKNAWMHVNGVAPNNVENYKRACIMTANGQKINGTASSSHLYGNDKTKIDAFDLYLGGTLDKPVYNITKHSDGTVTLSFLDRSLRPEITCNKDRYQKVNDLSDIAANDTVILVNEADGRALSSIKTASAFNSTEISLANGTAKGNDDIFPLQLVYSTKSKQWGLRYKVGTTNYYLCASSNGTLTSKSSTSTASLASISFSDGNASIKFGGSYSASTIGYSDENVNFCCFSTGSGQPIQLYKKVKSVSDDVNGDGSVDISDVNIAISAICGEAVSGDADVNGDGKVDVSDVNHIISTICSN